MRLLLLVPLLGGCGWLLAPNDGSYLMTSRLESDSCYEDNPAIGQDEQAVVSLYRTSAGTLVLEVPGGLLTGPAAENQEFEVSRESTSEVTFDGCDRDLTAASLTLEGTFVPDLGFEGTTQQVERYVQENCPDDEEQTCTRRFEVTALKLDASTAIRPTGSIAWGYFSGGGY